MNESAIPKVILIGGVGRTGTNILKDVLCDHPEGYGLPFESRITVDPDGIAPTLAILENAWSPFLAHTAIKRLDQFLRKAEKKRLKDKGVNLLNSLLRKKKLAYSTRPYKEWELGRYFAGYKFASKRLVEDLSLMTYTGVWPGTDSRDQSKIHVAPYKDQSQIYTAAQDFFSRLYKPLLEMHGARFYVDDNTYNILFAKQLLSSIPTGHLLHVVRDPRDTAVSYLHQRWTPNNLEECASLIDETLTRWLDVRRHLHHCQYTEIRLEDFCTIRRNTTTQICKRCQISNSIRLFERRLTNANMGRWKVETTRKQKNMLNNILGDWVDFYEYKK